MGYYSTKQLKFAKYLCRNLGLNDDSFIDVFLNEYAKMYGYHENYGRKKYFNVSDAVQALMDEKNIRKSLSSLSYKLSEEEWINTTDLSNYTFCPISYSISKSFEIVNATGVEERDCGVELHERLNLYKRVYNFQKSGKVEHDLFNHPFIKEILKSNIVFLGHNGNIIPFLNKKDKIRSIPDYLFQDKSLMYFCVEEKFKFQRDPKKSYLNSEWINKIEKECGYDVNLCSDFHNDIERFKKAYFHGKPVFYLNHLIQLISYLINIKEYDLKYGYLIYWYYDIGSENKPYIHNVKVKKVVLDNYALNLYSKKLNSLRNFISKSREEIDIGNITPTKCARCVVNKYCGHKSKRYSNNTLPYSKDFLKLFSANYE